MPPCTARHTRVLSLKYILTRDASTHAISVILPRYSIVNIDAFMQARITISPAITPILRIIRLLQTMLLNILISISRQIHADIVVNAAVMPAPIAMAIAAKCVSS
jgi:hypothetical protein